MDADFSLVRQNTMLMVKILIERQVKDITICINACMFEEECQSLNFHKPTGICELLESTSVDVSSEVINAQPGWTFYETDPKNDKVGRLGKLWWQQRNIGQ